MSSYEETYISETYSAEFPPLGMVSIWFGVILIGITAVAHIFAAFSPQSGDNPIISSLQLGLVALIFGSLLYLLLRARDSVKLASVPLIINVGTLLIVRFVPFGALWQEMRFQWHWASYNEVVQLVENGDIQPDEQGYAALPFRYRNLVRDGAVIRIDKSDGETRIFYYTKHISPNNFSGYYYRSDNNPPQPGDFDGRWRYVAQKRPYWFYCSSY
ncbi:MAG: chromate transporter [Chloroflexi bacterium]|nr:chromate transporter [Chloroflexota bacterium]